MFLYFIFGNLKFVFLYLEFVFLYLIFAIWPIKPEWAPAGNCWQSRLQSWLRCCRGLVMELLINRVELEDEDHDGDDDDDEDEER